MTGLEKILAEILDEAKAEAEHALAAAKAKADEMAVTAKAEADTVADKARAAAAQDVADVEYSRNSALALQRRQRTLAQKQALLAETLEKARDSLYALPDGDYFGLLVKLAAKTAQPGEGELLLNEADLARMPKDFEKQLAGALPTGSTLKVGGQARPIDGGFVLKYGDVEENCSFAAIFDAREDEFSDLIRDVLFT